LRGNEWRRGQRGTVNDQPPRRAGALHPNEQIGFVEEGALLTVASDKPARVIDVFAPPRNVMEPLKCIGR